MLQRWRISRSRVSGAVRRVVMKHRVRGARLPLRVTVVLVSSMIQLQPGQFCLM